MKNDIMQYKGYHGSVETSVEDQVLHGSILFINDLITYEAETLPRLKQEFEAAVDDYLETCQELEKEPDKEFSGTFNVRIGQEMHKKAAMEAYLEGISLNEFVRRTLHQALKDTKNITHQHHHEHVFTIETESSAIPFESKNPSFEELLS